MGYNWANCKGVAYASISIQLNWLRWRFKKLWMRSLWFPGTADIFTKPVLHYRNGFIRFSSTTVSCTLPMLMSRSYTVRANNRNRKGRFSEGERLFSQPKFTVSSSVTFLVQSDTYAPTFTEIFIQNVSLTDHYDATFIIRLLEVFRKFCV